MQCIAPTPTMFSLPQLDKLAVDYDVRTPAQPASRRSRRRLMPGCLFEWRLVLQARMKKLERKRNPPFSLQTIGATMPPAPTSCLHAWLATRLIAWRHRRRRHGGPRHAHRPLQAHHCIDELRLAQPRRVRHCRLEIADAHAHVRAARRRVDITVRRLATGAS